LSPAASSVIIPAVRIFITGVNGFLAGKLAGHLSRAGHQIRGCSRSPSAHSRGRVWLLEDPPDPSLLEGADVLIHAAHDATPGALHRNVDGTLALANAARRVGVGRQIFLSALSAADDSESEFGRAKRAIERVFLDRDTVIRPGLVIGPGGLFDRVRGMLREYPYLPLPEGGRAELPILGLSDFCRSVEGILDRPERREFNLYSEKPKAREFLDRLRQMLGSRVRFVPMSMWPVFRLAFRWSRLPGPSDVDLLQGLMNSRSVIRELHLLYLVERPAAVDEVLREL
jgi:nucleoside-diphosphate-sugar epimerase